MQSVVICIFYYWCEVMCPGIEFTVVIWTKFFSKLKGDTQSRSGTEWLQWNKTELSGYSVWGIIMTPLVTACLLPGGINKLFLGKLLCWLCSHVICQGICSVKLSHFTFHCEQRSLGKWYLRVSLYQYCVFVLKRNL